jgi:tetratricopeptide (TPR) repeat protein
VTSPRATPWLVGALIAVLMGGVVGLQLVLERYSGVPSTTAENVLYVRSPETMKRLALSYDSLLADVYWIRAVQHYGGTRLSTDPNKRYDLLFPLLDLTTSLDDRFNIAYYYGSTFLAEAPPGGPGRPDLAIALLEKGLRAQPEKWEFAQWIGFVHYWWRQDYQQAAAWFSRAAEFPGAPIWMAPLAASTLTEGGSRQASRFMWEEIARTAEDEWFRNEARRRLQQLDAMDQLDQLRTVAARFTDQRGAPASDWSELRAAGYLKGTPVDPTGTPYRLDAGVVTLDRSSRLWPLPAQRFR